MNRLNKLDMHYMIPRDEISANNLLLTRAYDLTNKLLFDKSQKGSIEIYRLRDRQDTYPRPFKPL